jgi:integrase/recombinase XerD
MEQINDMDIRVYLANRAKSGCKNSTLNTIISCFKSFFGWAEDQEYIVKSPLRKIKNIKVEKRVRKALTREELEMLRDACRTVREKAMVEFFYSTGCRLDEVQKLSLSKIDWADGSMWVVGKGNKEREVFLNDKAMFYLKKYINARTDQDDAVFVRDRRPRTRLCARMMEEIFSDLGKRAGIQKPVYPHLLRHTTATNMLNAGASLSEVQGLLGHEDPATTQIYAHLSRDAIKQSHKKNLAS